MAVQTEQVNFPYILLAEFDILKGSTIKHQYPGPCPVHPEILAEYMLPEGMHARESDWTIFFLRQSDVDAKPNEETQRLNKWLKSQNSLKERIDQFQPSCQGFTYVTDKWIPNERANAVRLSYENWIEGGQTPSPIILEVFERSSGCVIFSSAIKHSMNWCPLSEEQLFCNYTSEADSLPIGIQFTESEHFRDLNDIIREVMDPLPRPPDAPKLEEQIVVINYVRNLKDKSVKRGAKVKALAVCMRHCFVESFRPLILYCLDDYFRTEDAGKLEYLYDLLNAANFKYQEDVKPSTIIRMRNSVVSKYPAKRSNSGNPEDKCFRVEVTYSKVKMPLSIPKSLMCDEVSGTSLSNLISKFRHGIVDIYNAVFTNRRIMFLGYQIETLSVCLCCLSSSLLVTPAQPGTLQRTYPYVCLTAMNFLETPGFIAGCTNPVFGQHDEWWDLLVDIKTGEVRKSKHYQEKLLELNTEGSDKDDALFFDNIVEEIDRKISEDWVRSQVQQRTKHLVLLESGEEQFVEGADVRDWKMNQWRIETWRTSKNYKFVKRRAQDRDEQSPIGQTAHEVRKNARMLEIKTPEMNDVRNALEYLLSQLKRTEQVEYFISFVLEHNISYIAAYMYCDDENVQDLSFHLLQKFDDSVSGHKAIGKLNYFLLLQYERMRMIGNPSFPKQVSSKKKKHKRKATVPSGRKSMRKKGLPHSSSVRVADRKEWLSSALEKPKRRHKTPPPVPSNAKRAPPPPPSTAVNKKLKQMGALNPFGDINPAEIKLSRSKKRSKSRKHIS